MSDHGEWRTTPVLLALILVAFALRVYRLDAPALRGDEAFSVLFSRNRPVDMFDMLTSATEPHPPLSFLVLHYWGNVAGGTEFALRFTSAWAGLLVVPLIYALGRYLWGERVGLVAAALLTLNPFYIWHAQEARMYAMLVAACLASTLMFLMLLSRREWIWWVAYGVVTALSVYTHYYAFAIVLSQGLYAVLQPIVERHAGESGGERIRPLLRWMAGVFLTGLLYLPWLLSSWRVLAAYHGNARSDLAFFEPVYRSLLAFGQGQTLPRDVSLWFLPLWGGLLVGGIAVAWRRSRQHATMMALCFFVPWTLVFIDSLRRPAFDERYFMVSTPVFHLYVALALATLLNRARAARWARFLAAAVTAAIVAVSGLSLYNHYYNPVYARAPDWRALSQYLVQHTRAGDIVLLNYPDPAARYYYDLAVPWVLLPESFPVDEEATVARLEAFVQTYSRIWLTPQAWEFWDEHGLVEDWLDAHTERVYETVLDKFKLVLYHTPVQLGKEMVDVDALLEGGIELLGYVVRDPQGQAVDRLSLLPGQTVRLTLYWRTTSQVQEDYVVFVHLLDETGFLRGQRDGQPRHGTYPTKAWLPGSVVVDSYDLSVGAGAPSGNYVFEVGMYRPGDGTRLSVSGVDTDPDQRRVLVRDRVTIR